MRYNQVLPQLLGCHSQNALSWQRRGPGGALWAFTVSPREIRANYPGFAWCPSSWRGGRLLLVAGRLAGPAAVVRVSPAPGQPLGVGARPPRLLAGAGNDIGL